MHPFALHPVISLLLALIFIGILGVTLLAIVLVAARRQAKSEQTNRRVS